MSKLTKSKEYRKARYANNPAYRARVIQATKKSADKHFFKTYTHRLKKRTGERIEPIVLWRIAKKQKLICPLTGVKLNKNNISLDHILPVSKGGNSNPENLRFILREINLLRKAMNDQKLLRLYPWVSRLSLIY